MMKIRIYTDTDGHAPFEYWLEALPDRIARAKIRARVARVESGNFGDCKLLRDGVSEMRIDYGPGYRVYFMRRGFALVILLAGGNKSTQDADIARAITIAKEWSD